MYRTGPIPARPSPIPSNFQSLDYQASQPVKLTRKETEVLQWSAIGKSSWEIGQIVNCSEAGVNYHFCNIRRKFGVSSRWSAVCKAMEQGLIEMPGVR